jgi:hypothetical protein
VIAIDPLDFSAFSEARPCSLVWSEAKVGARVRKSTNIMREEPVLASFSCQWHVASCLLGSVRRRENSKFREVEITTTMTEALSTS